jgi:hypothetical protein
MNSRKKKDVLRGGSTQAIVAERGTGTIPKVVRRDPVDAVRGCLKLTRPTDGVIAEMRGDG